MTTNLRPSRRAMLLTGVAAFVVGCSPPQAAKPHASGSAAETLSAATTRAAQAGKQTFVVFHATWCPYCKHLLRFLADPQAKAIIDQHYEVLLLNVREGERGDQALEFADAADVLSRLGGADKGVPFMAIIGADGAPLATSIGPEGNIGAPATPEDLAHFRSMLSKSAPSLSEADMAVLLARLEATRNA